MTAFKSKDTGAEETQYYEVSSHYDCSSLWENLVILYFLQIAVLSAFILTEMSASLSSRVPFVVLNTLWLWKSCD